LIMRRLSAIMFTDMVGYSALTQTNEALALDLLDEHRKILRPFFLKHEGREIETAGDSFFVEFNSAVEATHCAIEIQTALHERNQQVPAERQILLRIGLHIGDVVYMENHVHGDGVNIAARIEPLAPAGGICISEDVTRQIRNKVPYPMIQLGAEKLKNISMPVNIYQIALPWLAGQKTKRRPGRRKMLVYGIALLALAVIGSGAFFYFKSYSPKVIAADSGPVTFPRVRLAVLPLSNISKNPQDEFFADGMTEELISSLSKISGLNVIARTSIMKYKDTDKDIRQISNELMVGTVLEGSVRKVDNKARITVQLIDAASQEHIWSMDYDRELKDIFMIQSEIAQNVANELKVRLVGSEKQMLEKNQTENMPAFQENLIGKQFMNRRTSENIQTAITHFEKAIKYDPAYALPYANAAYCYTLIGVAGYGNAPRTETVAKAKRAIAKALKIDPSLAEAHAALGYIRFRIDWDWEGAEQALKEAIALQPSYATAHEWYGLFLAAHGRLDESLKEMELAYKLDPFSPSVSNGLARIYHFRKEYDLALQQAGKTFAIDSNYAEGHFTAGMIFSGIPEREKAEAELKKALDLSGRRTVILGMLGALYAKMAKQAESDQVLAELRTPPMNNDKLYATAVVLDAQGHADEATAILEKLVDEKYGLMIYMKVQQDFFSDYDSPRFKAMLRKMGF
jgi:adenylate cyclase